MPERAEVEPPPPYPESVVPERRSDPGASFEPEPEQPFNDGWNKPHVYPNGVTWYQPDDDEPEQRNNVPIVPVRPVAMEPVHEYPERHMHPVTYVHPEQVVMPESRQMEVPVSTPPPAAEVQEFVRKLEEKTSIQKKKLPELEEKASGGSAKRKVTQHFNGGGGRIHTEAQIDEILDEYLESGELPDYVSERQRWSYKHHIRLAERRELRDKQGLGPAHKAARSVKPGRSQGNITKLPRTKVHGKRVSR